MKNYPACKDLRTCNENTDPVFIAKINQEQKIQEKKSIFDLSTFKAA